MKQLLEGARERLGEPRCQQVLDEFQDDEGRPIRARLAETGQELQDYLGLVIFYDGRQHPVCGQRGTLAVARVGGRAVWVCPAELAAGARRDPVWVEATLIHEALNTLGLGENPPSSREITSRVIRHAGLRSSIERSRLPAREPPRGLEGRPGGIPRRPHQRPVANRVSLDGVGTERRRDS